MDGDGEELRIWAFPHSLNATENGEQNVQVGGKCMNHMNHRSFGLVNSKFLQLCHSLDLWLLCSRHEVADNNIRSFKLIQIKLVCLLSPFK